MTRKRIKVIYMNNGGEYTDKDFMRFYMKEGISRECIAPSIHNKMGLQSERTR